MGSLYHFFRGDLFFFTLHVRFKNLTMASQKPNSSPPVHEMVYFPKMTSKLPASSGEFRKVLFTGLYSQVVLMTIPVGGDIGDEVHTVDQALTFTSGKGKATINGKEQGDKEEDDGIDEAPEWSQKSKKENEEAGLV